MGKIVNFNQFLNQKNSSNESLSSAFSKVKDFVKSGIEKASDWMSSFRKAVKDNDENLPKITDTKSPAYGLPAVMLFRAKDGDLYEQIKAYDKKGILPPYMQGGKVDEGVVGLEWTGEGGDVRNIHADKLKNDIMKLYRSKGREGRAKPIFIYGAPGIGKTQIVSQACKELGIDIMKLDLQFMSPEDFLGIPSKIDYEEPTIKGGKLIKGGEGATRMNPPVWLPRTNGEEDKGGLIFMDEMNRASKPVLNAIMQFVQEGRIMNFYNLPSKWVIVAAGNRPEEAEGVQDLDFALADRFTVKNYVPTVEKWAEWAETNKRILPELVTFLMHNKDLFHRLDTDVKSINFPTPRSWSDGALILHDEIEDQGVESWRDIDLGEIEDIFFDQVGPMAAGKFVSYLKILKSVTDKDIQDILNDPERAKTFKIPASVLYGLAEMVLGYADKDSIEQLYNIVAYFARYNELEFLSWVYKTILENNPDFRFIPGKSSTPEDELKKKAAGITAGKIKGAGLV
jgi:hypothetical protein